MDVAAIDFAQAVELTPHVFRQRMQSVAVVVVTA